MCPVCLLGGFGIGLPDESCCFFQNHFKIGVPSCKDRNVAIDMCFKQEVSFKGMYIFTNLSRMGGSWSREIMSAVLFSDPLIWVAVTRKLFNTLNQNNSRRQRINSGEREVPLLMALHADVLSHRILMCVPPQAWPHLLAATRTVRSSSVFIWESLKPGKSMPKLMWNQSLPQAPPPRPVRHQYLTYPLGGACRQ